MGWSLNSPKISSSGNPLVLKVSYRSITSLGMLTGVQCERRMSFPVITFLKKSLPGGFIGLLWWYISIFPGVHLLDVPIHILLNVGGKNSFSPHQFQGRVVRAFCVGQSCSRFRWRKIIQPKIAVATRWNIINLTRSSPRCHLRSYSLICIKNHLFIVGIVPILNKELEFIYQYDCSDRTCVYI